MADEKPTLHVDTDWKKQAQEEKRRLAEKEKERAVPVEPSARAGAPSRESAGQRVPRELPAASFGTLVQGIVTQILFHLGDIATRGGEPTVNLDLAKHHIDTLGVLEEKTRGNLSEQEQRLLDSALYETRMRYVSVASQMIT